MTRIGGLNYQITANNSGFSKVMVGTRSDLALTKRLMRESKPAAENMSEGLDRLKRLYKSGAIDLRAYRFALDKLNREQREAVNAQRAGIPIVGKFFQAFSAGHPALLATAAGATAAAVAMRGLRMVITSVREQMESLDGVAKSAETLGIGVESIQRMHFAAEQSKLETDALDKSLAKMVKTVGEASQGLGLGKAALKEMGLNAKSLNQLSPERQFQEIAEAMKGISNNNDRLRLTMQIFGRGGDDIQRMLNLGRNGLQELGGQIRTFGEEGLQGIEDANDAVNRLQHSITALSQALAIELAPTIEVVANDLRVLAETDVVFLYIEDLTEAARQLWQFLTLIHNSPMLEAASQLGVIALPFGRLNAQMERSKEIAAGWAELEAWRRTEIDQQNDGLATQAERYRGIGDAMPGDGTRIAQFDPLENMGLDFDRMQQMSEWRRRDQAAQLESDQRVAKSLRDTTDALREQIDTYGMSADQITLYKLAKQGANMEELAAVQALQEQRKQLTQSNTLQPSSSVSIAQSILRGSAADLDRNAKLELGGDDPQREANKHLEKIRDQQADVLGVMEEMRDREPIEVEEVRL